MDETAARVCDTCAYPLGELEVSQGLCPECGKPYAFGPWRQIERFHTRQYAWVWSCGFLALAIGYAVIRNQFEPDPIPNRYLGSIAGVWLAVTAFGQLRYAWSWIEFDWLRREITFSHLVRKPGLMFWRRYDNMTVPMSELVSAYQIPIIPSRRGPLLEVMRVKTSTKVVWLPPHMKNFGFIDEMVHWIVHGTTLQAEREARHEARLKKRKEQGWRWHVKYVLLCLGIVACFVVVGAIGLKWAVSV